MIRRDYIIRVIEECVQALTRIRAMRHDQRWEEAREAVDAECEKLAAAGALNVARLSETELLARLVQDQPTHVMRERLFMIISLLQEAGEIETAQGHPDQAGEIFLKALNLLLETSAEEEIEPPEYVPKVEALLQSLANTTLPVRTQALLMRHYESTGQWANAENALFSILDATGNDPASLELGTEFYERILRQNDATLAAGNLPRNEAEEGLREMKKLATES